ncbi:MAG: bifunctional phosphoribosylaminoimidazolecarboxamide formyltransferase/IMP cyclohydrolase, partial [Terriglobales bacterium]
MTSAPRRALLSVSDKTGLAAFATRLAALGFELISTGGTAETLRQAGLGVREVAEITESPEMLEGRVKTLHPRIHGGLLGRWGEAEHRRQMERQGIAPIELVVVNLYPFERVAERASAGEGVERAELIENIDIGGPAMLRSGAKNYESVGVVTDPADYAAVAAELEAAGKLSLATRWRLAQAAFRRTAAYDAAISAWIEKQLAHEDAGAALPSRLSLILVQEQTLRYGENPHQQAAFYADGSSRPGVASAQQLQGKELSYNNINDTDA